MRFRRGYRRGAPFGGMARVTRSIDPQFLCVQYGFVRFLKL